MSTAKNNLRQHLLKQRDALSGSEKNISSQRVTELLLDYFSTYAPATIGAYLAFGGELNITPALHRLASCGHHLAVPRISQHYGQMHFYYWQADAKTQTNRFGIAEPDCAGQLPLPVQAFDVLLIPLVGFDAAGHRLGMGGGYYDRWLTEADSQLPERIGIAYHWQQQAHIPFDTMDQALHRVITDRGMINC